MDTQCSRRGFLVAAGAGAGLLYQASGGNAETGGSPAGMAMDPLADRFPRTDPAIKQSPPPKTMGKQMGRVVTLGKPAIGYEMDDKIKVFELIAQPVEMTIVQRTTAADETAMNIPPAWQRFRPRKTVAKTALAWGYNGICPGPTLEATEGERVRIVLKNELPEPTAIHWHGFELPFAQDGAAGYQPFQAHLPTLPGQTRVYEFDLIQSGTLMYHTGFNVTKQEGMGLGGLFVVHPREERRPVDHDFAILLQQWNFIPGNDNPNINLMEPTFATFNGKTSPDIPMMDVQQGQRVRIRLGNLSLMAHPIHLHGHVFEIVGTGGGPIPESARWKDVTVAVAPGQSRDIELVAWNPGTWRFHCHVLHHIMNQMPYMPMGIAPAEGMFTHLNVIPKDPNYDPKSADAPWTYPPADERI